MSVASAQHTAVALRNGRVLVIGGATSAGLALGRAELWSPATNTWSAAGQMSIPRIYAAVASLEDGRVLETGGKLEEGIASWSSTELYTPPNGAPCTDASVCPSGHCVDGVCCDTACNESACEVCAVAVGAAFDGVCEHLAGDGSGECARGCLSARDCRSPSICDESGHCAAPPAAVSDNSGCSAAPHSSGVPWSFVAALCLLAAGRKHGARTRLARGPARC
jgi:hypothetical protein